MGSRAAARHNALGLGSPPRALPPSSPHLPPTSLPRPPRPARSAPRAQLSFPRPPPPPRPQAPRPPRATRTFLPASFSPAPSPHSGRPTAAHSPRPSPYLQVQQSALLSGELMPFQSLPAVLTFLTLIFLSPLNPVSTFPLLFSNWSCRSFPHSCCPSAFWIRVSLYPCPGLEASLHLPLSTPPPSRPLPLQ